MSNQKKKDHRDTLRRALTHEERKKRKQRSRERKASEEGRGPRRRDWSDYADGEDEEALDFEAMRSASTGPRTRPVAEVEPPSEARSPTTGDSAVDERLEGDSAPASSPDLSTQLAHTASDSPSTEAAIVIGLARGRATVWCAGERFEAELSAELARAQQTRISVGDHCVLRERAGSSPLVVEIAPRRTRLSRPDPADPRRERVIAANIDSVCIVLAARQPRLRHRLIDRYRLAIEYGGAEPVICVSKCDLIESVEARAEIDAILDLHRATGVPAFTTSIESGEGLDDLLAHLRGRVAVFVGQSGTGKSSLLSALDAGLELETGRVREGDGKGRHTTTSSSLHWLEGNTRIIDTPGIRGFGLWRVGEAEMERTFPDVAELARGCRFDDCSHVVEPGCAVRAAVESGALNALRYDAYCRVQSSLG